MTENPMIIFGIDAGMQSSETIVVEIIRDAEGRFDAKIIDRVLVEDELEALAHVLHTKSYGSDQWAKMKTHPKYVPAREKFLAMASIAIEMIDAKRKADETLECAECERRRKLDAARVRRHRERENDKAY